MHDLHVDADASTQERVLQLVIERGPISAAELAELLDLTPAGVRRHIAALEREERIVVHEPAGPELRRRGRPARFYVATDAGRSGMSHSYPEIATAALDYLHAIGGPEAVEHFADARLSELERRYQPRVEAAGSDPRRRARALATALSEDGYAATIREVGTEGFAVQLCQGNCPVLAVAEAYPQLCDAETRAFSRMLGVHVQRLATLAGGEHVCTTHIPVSIAIGRPSTTPSPAGDETEGN
ncbi:MAG TPA: winged helix-turn-helix transcriptional regulator [Actinomycetaceae bacterium]|nr:winged helix-turn-helix transcriptional regulator [Actinomycetaceae bacterium]